MLGVKGFLQAPCAVIRLEQHIKVVGAHLKEGGKRLRAAGPAIQAITTRLVDMLVAAKGAKLVAQGPPVREIDGRFKPSTGRREEGRRKGCHQGRAGGGGGGGGEGGGGHRGGQFGGE